MGANAFQATVEWQGSIEATFTAQQTRLVQSAARSGGFAEFYQVDPSGTRFLETVWGLSSTPAEGFSAPLSDDRLTQAFRHTHPTPEDLQADHPAFDAVMQELEARGLCFHFVLYDQQQDPVGVYFFGWSLN